MPRLNMDPNETVLLTNSGFFMVGKGSDSPDDIEVTTKDLVMANTSSVSGEAFLTTQRFVMVQDRTPLGCIGVLLLGLVKPRVFFDVPLDNVVRIWRARYGKNQNHLVLETSQRKYYRFTIGEAEPVLKKLEQAYANRHKQLVQVSDRTWEVR